MAVVYATHHLYPDNPQLFIIDVRQVIKLRGEANTVFWQHARAETFWEIQITTSALDSSGEELGGFWSDIIGTEQTVHDLVTNKIAEISAQIDWSKSIAFEEDFIAQVDRYAPIIYWQYPISDQEDIPIDTTIVIRIKDPLPSYGIDISTLVFKVDGFEVNPTIYGNKYDYTISYKPLVGR